MSGREQQFLDLRSNPPILGLHCALDHGYQLSGSVEEVLMKVPAATPTREEKNVAEKVLVVQGGREIRLTDNRLTAGNVAIFRIDP